MQYAIIFIAICSIVLAAPPRRQQSFSSERGRDNNDDFSDLRSASRSNSPDPSGNFLRIKVEILKLTNDGGVKWNGGSCDTFGTCDPICYANLDTERPNAEWPGSKPDTAWPTFFGVDNVNSPYIGVTFKKDICGPIYHEANLRIYCMDVDPATKNDMINQWDCPINRLPSASESRAEWSPEFQCLPKYQADKMRLTYRYQVYNIPRAQCNSTLSK